MDTGIGVDDEGGVAKAARHGTVDEAHGMELIKISCPEVPLDEIGGTRLIGVCDRSSDPHRTLICPGFNGDSVT